MESHLARLLVGLTVQIGRSDGRVHGANVKSVDATKSSVLVEWHERNTCLSKEVEIGDLCALNPELQCHINGLAAKAASPLSQVPEPNYEGRLRSSRIPAPSSFTMKNRTRQTSLFPVPCPAESARLIPSAADPCPPSVLTTSTVPNQQRRKNEARQPAALPQFSEAPSENKDPQSLPPPHAPKGRRITVAPQDLHKSSKRISSVVKPSDRQTKRGKFAEVNRPNQKFYQMIQDFRETLEISPLSETDAVETYRICVCVRKRPLNKQELAKKEIDVVSVPGNGSLLVHEPKQKVDLTKYLENQSFQFDYSFNETVNNELVYRFTARPLVQAIFEGSMATCFAYGQTGSGKTHTMGGDFTGKQQNSAKGIYAATAQDVFTLLNQKKYASLNLSVYVSFFEIYNGKVFDLLNKKTKLRVLEDEHQQVQVVGLEEVYVTTAEDVIKMIGMGSACRTSGQTSANANSSRSHAILQIVLRRSDRHATLHGKFSLVDLAGNERGTDVSGNDRNTMVETAEINCSLLALKECIRSLGKNSDHIPFRMSTLTKVLRDSFIGGKSRICMIAMVSPGMTSCDYTLNTLRYADRVKELNHQSKSNRTAKEQETVHSSSEEDSSVASAVYETISAAARLKGDVYDELQGANKLVKQMENTTYDIESSLPELVDYARKLLGTVLELESAVDQERLARMMF